MIEAEEFCPHVSVGDAEWVELARGERLPCPPFWRCDVDVVAIMVVVVVRGDG